MVEHSLSCRPAAHVLTSDVSTVQRILHILRGTVQRMAADWPLGEVVGNLQPNRLLVPVANACIAALLEAYYTSHVSGMQVNTTISIYTQDHIQRCQKPHANVPHVEMQSAQL